MEKRQNGEDVGPALGALAIVLGLTGYGWWQLGEAGRLAWLAAVGHAEGYGPVPLDIPAQLEWLAVNRLRGMEGMMLLFVLAGLAGFVEGNAGREAAVLSGFGLRPLMAGRVLVLLWTGCLVLYGIAPIPLPYVGVAVCLAVLLGLATYKLARGRQRVQ